MNPLSHPDPLDASLSAHALFRCADDAEQTCERVGQVFRPHRMGVIGRSQSLAARMDHLRLARMSLNRLSYGASVAISSEPMDHFVMVFMPLAGVIDIRSGHQHLECTPAQPAVVGATQALHMHWRADCDVLILRLERSALEEACAAQLGHALSRPLEFELAMDTRSAGFAGWQSLMGFLASSAAFTGLASAHDGMAAPLERLAASTLLQGHRHNYSDALARPGSDAAPAFVRRAEDWMARHLDQAVSVEDLAAQVGVGVRTLYAAFRQHRNASPMAAHKAMRLDRVRAELLDAARRGQRAVVAEAAAAHGFSHMGHFSQSYLERFGELPSQTALQNASPLRDARSR
jgi:AraC-like DNA-binding protein